MTEEAKEARPAYLKKRKKENPEKVRRHMARYWQKKAEEARHAEEKNGTQGGTDAAARV